MKNNLTSRNYYDVLDGLRGTAALVILVFHYTEMTWPNDYVSNPLGHGFLAVDFFFCLSGFVIGFAYDRRIRTIGIRQFFLNRLIRLHPLVILSTWLGLAGLLLDPFADPALIPDFHWILIALAASLLLLPAPFMAYSGGALFPYNSPSWSLFLEYLANIFYAVVLTKVGRKTLLLFVAIAAVWLGFTARQAGWIIGGWDLKSWGDGFPRVAFSFLAGLTVFRFNAIWKNKFGFVLPMLMLMGVFFFPHHDSDWLTESLLIIVAFPLIICVGAGATVTGAVRRFCLFIGRLSYPLYMTHISVVWIFGNYYAKYHPQGVKLCLIVSGLILFNLIVAWAAMKFYDEPVRKWLTKRIKRSAS
jgi:peptidoglycan/LPS O-acetylase OafA/YrhL